MNNNDISSIISNLEKQDLILSDFYSETKAFIDREPSKEVTSDSEDYILLIEKRDRYISKIKNIVEQINNINSDYKNLTDESVVNLINKVNLKRDSILILEKDLEEKRKIIELRLKDGIKGVNQSKRYKELVYDSIQESGKFFDESN